MPYIWDEFFGKTKNENWNLDLNKCIELGYLTNLTSSAIVIGEVCQKCHKLNFAFPLINYFFYSTFQWGGNYTGLDKTNQDAFVEYLLQKKITNNFYVSSFLQFKTGFKNSNFLQKIILQNLVLLEPWCKWHRWHNWCHLEKLGNTQNRTSK